MTQLLNRKGKRWRAGRQRVSRKLGLAKCAGITTFIGSFVYMNLLNAAPILAMGPPPAQSGQSSAPAWINMVPLLLLVVVFYFILIRPQQKKARDHAELLKSIHRGDEVLTSGGILGEIVTVKDKSVIVRSNDAKFELAKSAITEIVRRSGDASES
jgi:preprotein translocase subunit YajC